ncbi:glycosyltransferase [Lutispora thermophila]|uniref:Glycosyltransferase, GT2 family n=1 Tax=Lutispora thermophila DSM 19022 TaxID=1122184 RepID=A0A1M6AQW0_9FIRM|nr:glycosyltransferase [Lutispora thermophila]SHI38708.1 Glycosyltransferase, GT2 family [Lutispora thermophila DSM 19022]
MRISLCMIVKNEEKNIVNCLDRALKVVDEAIVVDTGSTDNTMKLLLDNYGENEKVKIIQYEWENDFSKARNKSIEYATGDWILVLDADERIFCDREKLERFLESREDKAYIIPIYNIMDRYNIIISSTMIRLYKNENPMYSGAIHEQIFVNGRSYLGDIIDGNICKIYHYGYTESVFKEKNKQDRNMSIIKNQIDENSEVSFHWYNKGVMEMCEGNYDTAIDDFIKAHKLSNKTRMAFHNDLVLRLLQCMLMEKKYKMAIEFIKNVVSDPIIGQIPDIYYYWGIAHAKRKNYSLAVKNFKKAIDLGEYEKGITKYGAGSFLPKIEWAKVLLLEKKKEEAIAKYKEAVFDEHNVTRQGLEELKYLLREENRLEELNQLEKDLSSHKGSEGTSVNSELLSSEDFYKFKNEIKDNIQLLIENGMIKEAKEAIKEYESIVGNDVDIFSIKGVVAMMEGDMKEAEMAFKEGLKIDETSFDLQYNLAYLYQMNGDNQMAIYHYEKAFKYAKEKNDADEIYRILQELNPRDDQLISSETTIPNTSIIILTYNNLEYTKLCIDSIRKYTQKGTYEIIVVDNHSTDGTVDWLKEQKDLKLILNDENYGFPKGCNQGIQAAKENNDIILLNNDVIVTPNWLNNLRKCLYSSKDIGAVGAITNSCSNYQAIPVNYSNLDEMIRFAESNNISNNSLWEERLRLVGFCMLIKNEVVQKVGLMDEIFTPGNFEDDDYSFRIRKAGYKLMLCKDSFIHHFGSASFGKVSKEYRELLMKNREKFAKKWGFDPYHIIEIKKEITELIYKECKKDDIKVLHIGCAGGGTLLDIKNAIPSAKLYGIDTIKEAIVNTNHFAHIEIGKLKDIEAFKKNAFDYIIITEPQKDEASIIEILANVKGHLMDEGKALICLYQGEVTLSNKLKKKLLDVLGDFKFEIIQVNGQRIFSMEKHCTVESSDDMKLTFYKKEDLDNMDYSLFNDGIDVKGEYLNIIRRLDNNIEFENNLERLRMIIGNYSIEVEELKNLILKYGIDKVNLFNIVGITYYQFNFVEKALYLLKEAFRLDSKNTDTIYNISYVLHQINENKLALDFLERINVTEDIELQQLKQQIEEAV